MTTTLEVYGEASCAVDSPEALREAFQHQSLVIHDAINTQIRILNSKYATQIERGVNNTALTLIRHDRRNLEELLPLIALILLDEKVAGFVGELAAVEVFSQNSDDFASEV